MVDCVTLMGAEDVRSAGWKISQAASKMSQAASCISEALAQFRVDQEQHRMELETMLSNFVQEMGVVMGAQ